MSLKFIPPVEQHKYALSVGSFFKTYAELGTAKLAYHAHNLWKEAAHILERVGNEWYVLYTVEPKTEYKDLPWIKKLGRSYNYGFNNSYTYDRYRAKPMTREEYAAWRLKVEFERMLEMDEDELADYIEENHSELFRENKKEEERAPIKVTFN